MSRRFTFLETLALRSQRNRVPDTSALDGTLAQAAAREHEVNRLERMQQWWDDVAGCGHDVLEKWLRTCQEDMRREGDVIPKLLDMIRESILGKVAPSLVYARDPKLLLFLATDDDTVSASYSPCSDGSGLILICEGLMGLVDLLSKQFTLSADVRMGRLPILRDQAFSRAAQQCTRDDEYSWAVDVCILRWRLLHQRLYGNAASLQRSLPLNQQRVADAINGHAMRFVMAHECSHHLLGHDELAHGFSTAAGLRPLVDDVQLESDADHQALDLLSGAGEFGIEEALGALVAIMAVEYFEMVAFVRPGVTHPEPRVRADRVLARLPLDMRKIVVTLLARVRRVANRAANLSEFVSASYWKTMYESDEVLVEPHSLDYVRQVFEIDRLGSGPLDRADRIFEHLAGELQLDLMSPVAELREGSLREGLLMLAVKDRAADVICDPLSTLSFSHIMHSIKTGVEKLGGENRTAVLVAALTCSRIIEERIRGECTSGAG